ncbi:putative diacylglycerol kinase zeta-like [Capsicum annuum]|nr:putative diacylglycerol kinase zeta-like [Capsicum annuum]
MFKQRNLFEYLKTSGIIASDTSGYSKNDIVVAIQKVFDNNVPFNVYLTCFDPKIQDGFVYLKEVTLCTDFFGTSFLSCLPQPDEGIKTCSVTGAKIRLPLRKPQKILQEVTDGTYPMFE